MSEREEVEKLLRNKNVIEKKIQELKNELDLLKDVLKVIDHQIAEKSFKVSKMPPKPPATPPKPTETIKPMPPEPIGELEQTIPLKASDGTLLANLYMSKNELKVVPDESIKFNVNTPPFQQFLISRVLNGMTAKDREDVMDGKITPDDILSYRVNQEGDLLIDITVKNFRDEKRAITLRNSFRWTLEKMYEKMKLSRS
jgi:hypothetical protein